MPTDQVPWAFFYRRYWPRAVAERQFIDATAFAEHNQQQRVSG